MYRLMIVEDEMFVRIGLENALEWDSLNIELIASVSNGEEALDVYSEKGADLIITDLKMPQMDGIELIRRIREKDSHVKFIILTCVEELKMAQEAMRQGVSAYFTKYDMKLADLYDCIQELCGELNKSQNSSTVKRENEQPSFEHIFKWLCDETEETIFLENMKELISSENKYCFFLIQLIGENEILEKQIKPLITVIKELTASFRNFTFIGERDKKVLLLYRKQKEELQETEQFFSFVCQRVKSYFNLECSVFRGNPFNTIEGSRKAYRQLSGLTYLSFYFPNQKFFSMQDESDEKQQEQLDVQIERIAEAWASTFSREYQEEFTSFRGKIKNFNKKDIGQIKEFFGQWGQLFFALLHLMNVGLYNHPLFVKIRSSFNLEQIGNILCEQIKNAHELIQNEPSISDGIMRAIQYIRENLSEGITLSSTARYVNFSEGYLSYLFRQELDITFTEFVMKLRIKKASILLINTSDKLYDIALQSGFQNPSYFNKAFRKVMGISPSEYRAMHRKGELNEK